MTKLHLAVEEGDEKKVIGLLTPRNVNSKNDYGLTPLIVASKEGHARMAKILIESGASLIYAGRRGKTALHIAAEKGHAETVETLLAFGIDVDRRDRFDRTPLMWACIEGKHLVVALLLKSGADVHLSDRIGSTPLHLACAHGKQNVVKLLLKHGSNVNCMDRSLNTPLHLAVEKGHAEIVLLLTNYGAYVSVPNRSLMTPLHLATKLSDHQLIISEILLKCGAEVNAPNVRGLLPLEMAFGHNFFLLIPLLVCFGAVSGDSGSLQLGSKTGRKHSKFHISPFGMATTTRILHTFGYNSKENDFKDGSIREFYRTKSETVADTNFSYFNIWTGKRTPRTEICQQTLTLSHCEQRFPVFGWLIHYRYKINSFKANLFQCCINRLGSESDLRKLPLECIEKVCRFLTIQELKILMVSFTFDVTPTYDDEARWPESTPIIPSN